MNTADPQLQQKIFTKQQKPQKNGKTPRNVWQDKDAVRRVRQASPQPVTVTTTPRTRKTDTSIHRSQTDTKRRKLVQVAAWVDEPIRAQLLEISRSEGLSISQTIAALLKDILRQRLHQQHAALLPEIIEHAVAKAHRRLANRLAFLMVRIALDTGESRVLDSNMLGMMVEMNDARLKDILATAKKRAQANLTRKTPQLTELVEKVKQWLLEGEEGAKTSGSR